MMQDACCFIDSYRYCCFAIQYNLCLSTFGNTLSFTKQFEKLSGQMNCKVSPHTLPIATKFLILTSNLGVKTTKLNAGAQFSIIARGHFNYCSNLHASSHLYLFILPVWIGTGISRRFIFWQSRRQPKYMYVVRRIRSICGSCTF